MCDEADNFDTEGKKRERGNEEEIQRMRQQGKRKRAIQQKDDQSKSHHRKGARTKTRRY
jgi:hypothetical protein